MLEGPPRGRRDEADALAALGLPVDLFTDPEPEENHLVELWPDTIKPAALFSRMATQWRMGPGGVVGLDYTPLPLVARAIGIKPRQACKHLLDIQVMEVAVLDWFAEQREE